MYKKIAWRLIALGCFVTISSAGEWQFQTGIGKGLNKALIQQYGIANAEAASIGVHIHVDWEEAFDWAEVDRTFIKVQYSHLWGEGPEHAEQLSISETGLVFRWLDAKQPDWFYEAGVGVSHLSDNQYQSIQTHGQNNFALDFAFGKRLELARNWELSVRYRHYSNGYTHRPNPGLDYAALVVAYAF